jgi:hypothetical protein
MVLAGQLDGWRGTLGFIMPFTAARRIGLSGKSFLLEAPEYVAWADAGAAEPIRFQSVLPKNAPYVAGQYPDDSLLGLLMAQRMSAGRTTPKLVLLGTGLCAPLPLCFSVLPNVHVTCVDSSEGSLRIARALLTKLVGPRPMSQVEWIHATANDVSETIFADASCVLVDLYAPGVDGSATADEGLHRRLAHALPASAIAVTNLADGVCSAEGTAPLNEERDEAWASRAAGIVHQVSACYATTLAVRRARATILLSSRQSMRAPLDAVVRAPELAFVGWPASYREPVELGLSPDREIETLRSAIRADSRATPPDADWQGIYATANRDLQALQPFEIVSLMRMHSELLEAGIAQP